MRRIKDRMRPKFTRGGGASLRGMLKARDGLKQAHRDVLVAVPRKLAPPPTGTNSKAIGS